MIALATHIAKGKTMGGAVCRAGIH